MRERSFSSALESLLLLSLAVLGLFVLALCLDLCTGLSDRLGGSVSSGPLASVLWLCCSCQIFNPKRCQSHLFNRCPLLSWPSNTGMDLLLGSS